MIIRLPAAPRRSRGAVFSILNALAFLFVASSSVYAQHDSTQASLVGFSGTVTLSQDVYDFATTPDGIEAPRRPANLTRFVFAPTITIGDYISLPFNIQISSRETNFITSSVPNPTFVQFLENPLNNLGFISISPKIGWAKAYIGTHTPIYSELSTGDQQIFGGGFDLTPGKFELAASTGIAQRAIEPDSAHGIKGAYARTLYMAKLGFGNPDSSCFALNFVRMKDDPNSIARPLNDSTFPVPQEGALASANFAVQIADPLRLTGEAAVSGFTMDVNAAPADLGGILPSSILAQRISTRADVAGTLAIDWKNKTWGIKTSGKYIGAGFVTPGYPFLTPDRLEFLVAPRIALFDGGLALNTSLGYRVNNLSQTKAATSTQIIGSATALATFSDKFSISGQFANFGVRNSETNDTLKIQSVANSFSVTPTYVLTGSSGTHSISATFSLDEFNDYNTVTGALASNNTRNIQALYSASWTAIPLSTTLIASNLLNHLPATGDLTINSITLEMDYSLLESKLTPMVQGTYSEGATVTSSTTFSPDIQRQLRIGLKWQIAKQLTLRITGTTTGFTYGGTRPGESFRESLIESSIGAQF